MNNYWYYGDSSGVDVLVSRLYSCT